MRYFFDTEFIEDGHTIELISLGIVAADGREFYAISAEYDRDRADPWLHDHVFDKLEIPSLAIHATTPLPRSDICDQLLAFVQPATDPELEIWGAWCAYDWVVVRQLFGKMVAGPPAWPKFCFDVIQWATQLGLTIEALTPAPPYQHNALVDARWTQQLWRDCEQFAQTQMAQTQMAQTSSSR
ncbi:MAG: 3'-5' exoribonuclease [Spirulina sp. SIO3F2]|nr:3'-5' exoribonuclease [Spirulina sp. SIO3F2]